MRSFPRRRESIRPLRSAQTGLWVPACAGMTHKMCRGDSELDSPASPRGASRWAGWLAHEHLTEPGGAAGVGTPHPAHDRSHAPSPRRPRRRVPPRGERAGRGRRPVRDADGGGLGPPPNAHHAGGVGVGGAGLAALGVVGRLPRRRRVRRVAGAPRPARAALRRRRRPVRGGQRAQRAVADPVADRAGRPGGARDRRHRGLARVALRRLDRAEIAGRRAVGARRADVAVPRLGDGRDSGST